MTQIWPRVLICSLMIFFPAATKGADKIGLKDSARRPVEITQVPKRLIGIGSGVLRLLCYLSVTNRVVGVEAFERTQTIGRPYMLAYPELAKLPPIGPGGPNSINKEPDLEAVLRVAPEVIFATSMGPAKADALQKKLGIPVVILSYGSAPGTFDEAVYDSLRVAGKILKNEKRAEEVIRFIEKARQELLQRAKRVEESKKPRVYVGGIGLRGMQGIESTDSDYYPFDWIRARNLARELGRKGHLFIDKEKLLAWNPDVIFVDAWGLNPIKQDYQRKPDFYQSLKAVREKKTHILYPFNMYTTNIETVIADAYAAGKILYPKNFADIDLQRKANEIYRFFLGSPVYAQMAGEFGEIGSIAEWIP